MEYLNAFVAVLCTMDSHARERLHCLCLLRRENERPYDLHSTYEPGPGADVAEVRQLPCRCGKGELMHTHRGPEPGLECMETKVPQGSSERDVRIARTKSACTKVLPQKPSISASSCPTHAARCRKGSRRPCALG